MEFDCDYFEEDELIELEAKFVLGDGIWIIEDSEANEREIQDEERKRRLKSNMSPAPPEGQKTLDAGFDELVWKLIAEVKKKSWDGAKQTGVHPSDCGLHTSDPPEIREKVLRLLPQFPSIGTIPAPATRVNLDITGILEDKETQVEVGFHWPDKKLKILYVTVKHGEE